VSVGSTTRSECSLNNPLGDIALLAINRLAISQSDSEFDVVSTMIIGLSNALSLERISRDVSERIHRILNDYCLFCRRHFRFPLQESPCVCVCHSRSAIDWHNGIIYRRGVNRK